MMVVVAVLVAGCRTGGVGGTDGRGATSVTAAGNLPPAEGSSPSTTPTVSTSLRQATAPRLPEDLPEYQSGILADGEVTFAEYEQAVLATVECLRDRGVEVVGPYRESDAGRYGGSLFVIGPRDLSRFYLWDLRSPTLEGIEEAEAANEECRREYFDWVEIVYADSNEPTQAEWADWYRRLQTCLEANGVEVPADDPTTLNLLATEHRTLGCPDDSN